MTIEQQALALVNDVSGTCYTHLAQAYEHEVLKALRAALERHEAFRQEVSEAVTETLQIAGQVEVSLGSAVLTRMRNRLSRFIIAPPVDPVEQTLRDMLARRGIPFEEDVVSDEAAFLRAALAKHGLVIRREA